MAQPFAIFYPLRRSWDWMVPMPSLTLAVALPDTHATQLEAGYHSIIRCTIIEYNQLRYLQHQCVPIFTWVNLSGSTTWWRSRLRRHVLFRLSPGNDGALPHGRAKGSKTQKIVLWMKQVYYENWGSSEGHHRWAIYSERGQGTRPNSVAGRLHQWMMQVRYSTASGNTFETSTETFYTMNGYIEENF